MPYSSGSLILDDDYNIFATGAADGTPTQGVANLNSVWGTTGTGSFGYGQSGDLSAVSTGGTITATQWSNLLTRMTTLADHQGTSITSISNPNAGDTISAYAALSANVTAIYNAKLNATANGADLTTNGTTTTTSTWSTQAQAVQTITFASADAMRYFFNAGGQIRISWSLTGGSDAKSLEWADLLTKSGTIVITGNATSKTIAAVAYTGTTKIGGSGSPDTLATGTGAEDYTIVDTVIYKQFADSAPYTANYIQVAAKDSGTTQIIITTTLQDDAADTVAPDGSATGDALDIVDGTLTQTMVLRPPSTTYLTSTWGTPTMNAISWTVS